VFELLAFILLISILGSLGVPIIVIILARFGYLPPLSIAIPSMRFKIFGANITLFGKIFLFAPHQKEPSFSEATFAFDKESSRYSRLRNAFSRGGAYVYTQQSLGVTRIKFEDVSPTETRTSIGAYP